MKISIDLTERETGPLHILVVGGGIGGLTAAIGLRRQGHKVTIFEQSRLANELGAAIHLAPNANGLLKRLGVDAESFGSVEARVVTTKSPDGQTISAEPLYKHAHMWQHKWLLAHRAHLHEALKKAALAEDKTEVACQLLTASRIVDLDADKATVTLENGTTHVGDIIIGADGVGSRCRTKISDSRAKPSGKSAFRFLIERSKVLEDPVTRPLVEASGELLMWHGNDRRVIMYPTTYGKLLNLVCIHPAEETNGSFDNWNQGGNKKQLLDIYSDFAPNVKALLEKADPDTLRLWQLLDMDKLQTWTRGRLALLGDAAHPFLPYQGQGGAMAIEDAISLSVLLPSGTKVEDLNERLGLYERCRRERVEKIQEITRRVGEDLNHMSGELDMFDFMVYNFGHDEWDHSIQLLRDFTVCRMGSVIRRVPLPFGPSPGPRQDLKGKRYDSSDSTFLTASIKFKTSRTLLQNLLPSSGFSFQSPGTTAFATFSVTTLDRMGWLGGSGYSHFGLYIHGIQYKKRDGTVLNGTYLPVLFENLADPIITGREELGFPKVFCDLDIRRTKDSYTLTASWKYRSFVTLSLGNLDSAHDSTKDGGPETKGTQHTSPDDGLFVYRYIPAVGEPGVADAEYPVFAPYSDGIGAGTRVVHEQWTSRKGSITFNKDMTIEDLPTLYHIIERLEEIPVWEILDTKLEGGKGVADLRSAKRIE